MSKKTKAPTASAVKTPASYMGNKTKAEPNDSPYKTPGNWTTMRPHKYCGMLDWASPRQNKANKTHLCAACSRIKARAQHLDAKDTSNRREEKMEWVSG